MLCFFGHHRSASSWTNDILQAIAVALGWQHHVVHNAAMFNHDLRQFCAHEQPDLLTFSNAKWTYLVDLPPCMGLHLVRDPRDILVSSYFSHRNSHPTDQWPELLVHRAELRRVPEAEGLFLELGNRQEEFEDMMTWRYDAPFIYELKMELLTQQPAYYFTKIFSFWDRFQPATHITLERAQVACNRTLWRIEQRKFMKYKLPRWRAESLWPWLQQEVLAANTFHLKSGGREIGQMNPNHHYRVGIAGSWRSYFTPELTRVFKKNHNDLLVMLGYETNADW